MKAYPSFINLLKSILQKNLQKNDIGIPFSFGHHYAHYQFGALRL
jgi:hypothetical protein